MAMLTKTFFLISMLYKLMCQVYDVTSFLDDHPGGDDVLLAGVGK